MRIDGTLRSPPTYRVQAARLLHHGRTCRRKVRVRSRYRVGPGASPERNVEQRRLIVHRATGLDSARIPTRIGAPCAIAQ